MTRFAQAGAALAASLIDDPFYRAITEDFGSDESARARALSRYFEYSLGEAERSGRCVIAPDATLGGAAWLLPRTPELEAAESGAKSRHLGSTLGPRGYENYYRIVGFMAPLAARVIPRGSWYLSIVGLRPAAQGRGLGATLLRDTLAEASRAGVSCYLETFTPRTLPFYERLGFRRVAAHLEPTTNAEYVVMRRDPPA